MNDYDDYLEVIDEIKKMDVINLHDIECAVIVY